MITFLLMTLFVVISPGVDTALITKRTIAGSTKDGIWLAIGISLGSLGHTIAVTCGLSALLFQSAWAFQTLKWVGALYLIYLGIQSLWVRKHTDEGAQVEAKRSPLTQGLLSNLLNPKVLIFFLTFLPQFVTDTDRAMASFLFMGLTYTLLSLIWFILYVICLHYIREWLLSPIVQRRIEGATGVVLILFGIKLLFTQGG
ncbi:LysE family translocator [Rossellomorea marisflavi]|uniref:LysE family translocator n=1 Tax=Rossellomorea marisflavi TaxID=189381 RepID=UPI00345A8F77